MLDVCDCCNVFCFAKRIKPDKCLLQQTLIGTKTFGKGIVQQEFTLGDASALKMTVETYYTPSGECIHKKGIEPDIKMEYKYTGDTASVTDMDSYDFSKDNQVQKGISVLKGKLVN